MSFNLFVANEDDWADALERQSVAQARAAATADRMSETDVTRLTQLAASYPWLRPGVALAATQAGLDDRTVNQVAGELAAQTTADRDGWREVGTPVPAIPQVYSPRVMTQLENADQDAAFGLGPAMPAGVDEVFPEDSGGGGLFGSVLGGVNKLTGGYAGKAVGLLEGPFHQGIRGFEAANPGAKVGVRTGLTVLDAGTQEIQQSFRNKYAQHQQGAGFLDLFNPAQELEAVTTNPGSNLGVALTTGDFNFGEGYFPEGTNEERRRENELQYGTIGGHAITMGRAAGQGLGFEVDSKAFTAVSGLTDFAVAVLADPADLPVAMIADARKAANAFQTSGRWSGHVRGVDPQRVDDFIKGPAGQAVVERFTQAGSDDFADLWRKSNGQIPAATLNDLVRAETPEAVTDILYNTLGVRIRDKGAAQSVLPSVSPISAMREGLQQHRLFNLMPAHRFDADDLDDTVRQIDRYMVNANAPADMRASFVNRAANTRWREDRFLLAQEMQHETQRMVLAGRLSERGRKNLDDSFRMFAETTGEARKYGTDDLGNIIPGLEIEIGDELVGGPGAQLMSEITQFVPLGDAREIRRATSALEPILNSPLRMPISWAHFVQDRVWKPTVLARVAWPVRVISEEQIRMAAAGNRSLIFHPAQAISYMVSGKRARGATDVAGDALSESVAYQRAMSQSRGGIIDDVIRRPASGWTLARKGDSAFTDAWADEIAEIWSDPIAREIARLRAGSSPYGSLDEIKAAYWDGALSHHRELWATSRPSQRVRTASPSLGGGPPASADEYIDSVARRVDAKTLGRDDIVTMASTGRWGGAAITDPITAQTSAEIRHALGRIDVDDTFRVKARTFTEEQVGKWDRMVDWTMSHLMTKPTNYLSRSPAYRQFYWRRVEEIASASDPATRRALADAARKANLDDVADRIIRQRSSGPTEVVEQIVQRQREVVREVVDASQPAWDDGPVLFHGARGRIPDDALRATGDSDPTNLFGPAFYSTDEVGLAETYARQPDAIADILGDAPIFDDASFLYEVRWTGDGAPRFLDMDDSLDPDVWRSLPDGVPGFEADEIEAALRGGRQEVTRFRGVPSAERQVAVELNAATTNSEVYSNLQRISEAASGSGEAWVMETSALINDALAGAGYHGFTYSGGVRTGGDSHTVYGWFEGAPVEIVPSSASERILDLNDELRAATHTTETVWENYDELTEIERQVNLSINEIDEIAKGHALDDTKGLLYDLTERSQFFDTNRLLFPFGEAWMEVLSRWANLVKENPALVRRGQKIISQANEGFFYENENDELVFNYPGSGWLTERFTQMFPVGGLGQTPGVPFAMTGRAQGLSVATEILPGAGPVVQMMADRIIPNRPKWDPVRRAIMPFGASESLTDLIIPPSLSKIAAGLTGDDQTSIFEFGTDPEQDRLFGNTVIDSMRHLESTGEYDLSTNNGQAKLLEDATLIAQRMWFLRGLGQFVSPTSPSFTETAIANDADLVVVAAVNEAFQEYRDEDPTTAYDRVLAEFGDSVLPSLVGKSTAIRPGAEVLTEDGNDWLRDHPWAEREFPRVWGYFAPSTGEFSHEGYRRSFESGARAKITPAEWEREVNDLRGRLAYDARREAVSEKYPDKVPANVREWLSDERRQLRIDFPGYLENEGIEGSTGFLEGVRELRDALGNDTLRQTEAGQAMADYFDARDEVFAAMRERDDTHVDSTDEELSLSLKGTGKWDYLRDALFHYGEDLVAESPDFANVWDRLLAREVDQEQE